MAIGPDQLNAKFKAELDTFENIIDQRLANQKLAPNSSVNVNVPSGMSFSYFQIIKERYLKAGWAVVKWNSDQREGDWLTFFTIKLD
jgi:hypothetical protein